MRRFVGVATGLVLALSLAQPAKADDDDGEKLLLNVQPVIPISINSKLMTWGKQRVQLGGGVRYWIDSPDAGPEGLGYRFQLTLLYPKS